VCLNPLRWLVGLALFPAVLAVHAACPLAADAPNRAEAEQLQMSWATRPSPIRVGEPFVMRLTLCPAAAQLVRVDATMPEHRHGMNYQPTFTALGDGVWEVKGMVWHMAGRWELRVDARLGNTPQRFTPSITLQ
jgi:hypothetical protein